MSMTEVFGRFEPRRLQQTDPAREASAQGVESSVYPPEHEIEEAAPPPLAAEPEEETPEAAAVAVGGMVPPPEPPLDETGSDLAEKLPEPPQTRCDHTLEIRNEAIRLAAIACGRALRHAVLLHPALIVAFVNDAMNRAESETATAIRINPAHAELLNSPIAVADDQCEIGDLLIEFTSGSIGADVVSRARALVASAAER